MRHLGVTVALTSCLLVPRVTRAGEVIFSYGPTTATRTDGGLVVGSTFSTSSLSSATFNSLGFIDVGSDGLAGSYTVGIWDASQNLLASTTVTPSSQLINGFRYASIPATTIPANTQFTIGALIPTNPSPDPWLEVQFVSPSAGFGGAGFEQFSNSLSLTYPANGTSIPVAVVNASDAVVPEPASMAGLAAAGALALGLRRRRRTV